MAKNGKTATPTDRSGRAGVPGNGKPFPNGSKIAKLQWKPKKSVEAPFSVNVPDTFTQAFFIEKDSKRFPNSGGWGYALFNYDAASDTSAPDGKGDNCGHACHTTVKAKDYIFHPVSKAVNETGLRQAAHRASDVPQWSAVDEFAKLIWQIASPKWKFDEPSSNAVPHLSIIWIT